MRPIPRWFARELKCIDPELIIEWDKESNAFLFWKDLDIIIGKEHFKERVLRAVYEDLNDTALSELRYRAWIKRNICNQGDSMAYYKWIKREQATELLQRKLDRRRTILEAQIAALQAELEAEQDEVEQGLAEASAEENGLRRDRDARAERRGG